MTTAFWLAIVALIGLALIFVLYPLFFYRPEKEAVNDIRHQNLLAYRSRIAELDAEKDAGNLDDATYQQMKEELAGSLLDDVDKTAGQEAPAGKRPAGRRSAIAIALVSVVMIPALAFYLYDDWGAVSQIEQWQTMKDMQASSQPEDQQMATLAQQLRERLEEQPDNLQGWAMLGRTYMNLENYGEAAWAFERLAGQVEDAPNEAATAWGLVAQARFFDSKGKMTPPVTAAIKNAQHRNPDEVNALGLQGINAFESGNYQQSIDYWGRIVKAAPDHPQLPSIRSGIVEAYRRLGKPVPQELTAPEGAKVTVSVSLADAFRDQVAPQTTLFIFAQNAEGSPMPLAVARLQASDLPTTVTLDDSMAMAPTAQLSDASKVMLTARLSPAGSAQPQSGDWQGTIGQPLVLADYDGQPVKLVIDQQLQ
ncbi:c-type cytochrome biogenesis protein CcmI [Marinobacter sp. 1Y8]